MPSPDDRSPPPPAPRSRYARLLGERARLRREIAALQRRLRSTNSAIADLGPGPAEPPTRADRRRGRPGAMRRAMVSLLRAQAPHPLHGDEIFAYLESEQLAPTGKHPRRTVYATLGILAGRGRVKRVGRNLWTAAPPTREPP